MEEKKTGRGGARRHGITQKPLTIKIDLELFYMLPEKNKNRFINEAIKEKLKNTDI